MWEPWTFLLCIFKIYSIKLKILGDHLQWVARDPREMVKSSLTSAGNVIIILRTQDLAITSVF